MRKIILPTVMVLLVLAFLAPSTVPAAAQDKPVDTKKLISEIVGDYDFTVQGQSTTMQFIEKDGKLFGAPVGETPQEINPVEGKPLYFSATSPDGRVFELQFVRNEKGVIDKCILSTMGITAEGMKVIK